MRPPRHIALCSLTLVVLGSTACSAGTPAAPASPAATGQVATAQPTPSQADNGPAPQDIQVVVTTPILGSIAADILACADQGSIE
ncbi:MAG: hypothetical protein ACKOE2_01405, partial [Actinomycetales bacterium]